MDEFKSIFISAVIGLCSLLLVILFFSFQNSYASQNLEAKVDELIDVREIWVCAFPTDRKSSTGTELLKLEAWRTGEYNNEIAQLMTEETCQLVSIKESQ